MKGEKCRGYMIYIRAVSSDKTLAFKQGITSPAWPPVATDGTERYSAIKCS